MTLKNNFGKRLKKLGENFQSCALASKLFFL